MKILCLQLARFGDIYQTWPVLRALRRKYPDAEIHFMVRERFFAATEGLSCVDKVLCLKTRNLLAPLYEGEGSVEYSLSRLSSFVGELHDENYDQVVNLSFSPSSSYLVDAISSPCAVVTGYTRYRDGFLCIPDDASSYFYAQVGPGRSNRIHLSDLFALIAGVELIEADFEAPSSNAPEGLPSDYIVVHVGGSESHKVCSGSTWRKITDAILKTYSGSLVFVGQSHEGALVPQELSSERILNWTGKTQLIDLFGVLGGAQLLIGCDSVALHMASLTQTPTINITFPTVSFWETGPRAAKSRVLWFEDSESVEPEIVADETCRIVKGQAPTTRAIEKVEAMGVLYEVREAIVDKFEWELTRALYMNQDFPPVNSQVTGVGFTRLKELATLALDQMAGLRDPERRALAVQMLDQVEFLITKVGQLAPSVSPVIRWFQAEKSRVGPGQLEEIITATISVFEKLRDIGQIYEIQNVLNESPMGKDLTWKY